ncbi:hypothetical protein BSZ22_02045 [Bradyrhizobium canariense]|uniref:Uncharacterized protein n=1 Tax=Bradyrhizobium canariense TaxID=255045 RepID=A0A1X3G6G7_9BRAD|nr:hypothetical protein BSZ22_02045 [Bradyrhizobium canariense]OSI82331.1 hypothetical protein BSZ23_02050 [Bradyrhizobium canariense]OSI96623.1 hypothetical protein BSZ25_01705 [Bradyrhizobium canariense]OSI98348.1 hypothetical protein BSZ24_01745 [Bradyrhizobium canariense]OSJ15681.1 hypothetical protein BSZ16_01760 [Bradyrhizobium canariense]
MEIISVLKKQGDHSAHYTGVHYQAGEEITALFVVPVPTSAKMAFLDDVHLTAEKAPAAIRQIASLSIDAALANLVDRVCDWRRLKRELYCRS